MPPSHPGAARRAPRPARRRASARCSSPPSVVGLEFEEPAVRALAAEGVGAAVETHLRGALAQAVRAADRQPGAGPRLPLPPRAGARGGLPPPAQARPGRPARALRRLGRRALPGPRPRRRARRGPRLPPRAGLPLPRPSSARSTTTGTPSARAAAYRLAAAGRRAFDREDMPAAANLLRRAVALLEPDDPRRRTMLLALGEAYTDIAEFALAEIALERGRGGGRGRPGRCRDRGAAAGARARTGRRRDRWGDRIVPAAGTAIAALEAAGNRAGAATAWRATGLGARDHRPLRPRRRGAPTMRSRTRSPPATTASAAARRRSTRSPPSTARPRCPRRSPAAARSSSAPTGDRRTEGLVRNLLARLVAMDGDVAGARELYRAAQRTLRDGGRQHGRGVHVAATPAASRCSPAIPSPPSASCAATTRRSRRWASATCARRSRASWCAR